MTYVLEVVVVVVVKPLSKVFFFFLNIEDELFKKIHFSILISISSALQTRDLVGTRPLMLRTVTTRHTLEVRQADVIIATSEIAQLGIIEKLICTG